MSDLTKSVLISSNATFENNRVYEGSFTISGTYKNGVINTRTHTISLGSAPDLTDLVLNGRQFDGSSVHTDRWGHPPEVGRLVHYTPVYFPSFDDTNEIFWMITGRISGSELIVTARSPSPYDDTVADGTITSMTVNYKLVDYSVAGGPSASTKLHFDSRKNYLKKDESLSGSTTLTLPAEFADPVTHTFDHDLGYIPFFQVGANIFNTSVIWSNNRVHERTASSSGGGDHPPTLGYYVTTNQIVMSLDSGTGSKNQSGNRDVYWNIYLDYGS